MLPGCWKRWISSSRRLGTQSKSEMTDAKKVDTDSQPSIAFRSLPTSIRLPSDFHLLPIPTSERSERRRRAMATSNGSARCCRMANPCVSCVRFRVNKKSMLHLWYLCCISCDAQCLILFVFQFVENVYIQNPRKLRILGERCTPPYPT